MIYENKLYQKAEVCLTTFVYGTKYQAYLPILLYSLDKAYPEYDVVLFLYDKLDSKIYKQITLLNLTLHYKIIDHVFSEYKITSLQSKALRWVLWDDTFSLYKYMYIVDIDMLYVREPLALHLQHIEHMKMTGLPFDNIRREVKVSHDLVSILYRIKQAGFRFFFSYLTYRGVNEKLSGLHFIEVERYYKILTKDKREEFFNEILSGKIFKYVQYPNNEVFLSSFMRRLGMDVDVLALQTNSYNSLDFNNPTRKEFRPHHGIHLGIFRSQQVGDSDKAILNSETYQYYLDVFVHKYLVDKDFVEMIRVAPENIRIGFRRLCLYYGINFSIS